MIKAALYARYSSNNQTEQSIEGQRHVCEQYAAGNGIEIVAEYIDRAISGTTDRRPEFLRMIADAGKGEWDIILVYKLDRFARDRYASAVYKHKLAEHGIRVVSATEPLTDSPEGVILESVLEGMDEYYSLELARKTKRGREESIRKGRYISGKAPFGYKLVGRELAIDETTAPLARQIFERYAAGETMQHIVDDLNARGEEREPGQPWTRKSVVSMFQNEIYRGRYSPNNLDAESECPALVTSDLWDAVNRIRAEHARRQRTMNNGKHKFILTGKLRCPGCGGGMSGLSVSGKYFYYRCKKCGGAVPFYHAEEVEQAVFDGIAKFFSPENAEIVVSDVYGQYLESRNAPSARQEMERQLQTVEKQLANMARAIAAGTKFDELDEQVRKLTETKEKLRESLAKLPKDRIYTQEDFERSLRRIVRTSPEEFLSLSVDHVEIEGNTVTVFIDMLGDSRQVQACLSSGCEMVLSSRKRS